MTELQLSCSKGDTSFQQQLHPRTSLGFVHQADSIPRPSSFAGASPHHIWAGDPLLLRLAAAVPAGMGWQPAAQCLPTSLYLVPLPSQGCNWVRLFFSFLNLLFDTFQQGSPNLPIFMPHLHIMRSFNNA